MRKYLLLAMILGLLLTACGGKEEQPDKGGSTPPESSAGDNEEMQEKGEEPVLFLKLDSGEQESEYVLRVIVENNPGVSAMRLQIQYDSRGFELIKAQDTGLFAGAVFGGDLAQCPYVLCWEAGASKTGLTENGEVAVLTFRRRDISKDGNYEFQIVYEPEDILDTSEALRPVTFRTEGIGMSWIVD